MRHQVESNWSLKSLHWNTIAVVSTTFLTSTMEELSLAQDVLGVAFVVEVDRATKFLLETECILDGNLMGPL